MQTLSQLIRLRNRRRHPRPRPTLRTSLKGLAAHVTATFQVKNNTFAKQLQTVVQKDKITRAILKKISQEDIKIFTKKDKFLVF